MLSLLLTAINLVAGALSIHNGDYGWATFFLGVFVLGVFVTVTEILVKELRSDG